MQDLHPAHAVRPDVLEALVHLRRLFASGARIHSSVLKEYLDSVGLLMHKSGRRQPKQAFRIARRVLGLVAEQQWNVGEDGRRRAAGFIWSIPAPPRVPLKPRPTAAPLPEPPPHLRDQCVRIGGRFTHVLGDQEYRRLLDGGAPLPTPSDEPWLQQRQSSSSPWRKT